VHATEKTSVSAKPLPTIWQLALSTALALAGLALTSLGVTPGWAQTTGAQSTAPDDDDRATAYDERITVTATGEAASVEGLPVSVTVLTREVIENTQEETVVDLVRRIPGVTVSQTGDRGGSASFFLRGTESDHVLALFDGVRLNSPYFAGCDFSTLSSAGIERIEVVRGRQSSVPGHAEGRTGGQRQGN
jgi:vitamin B12 transporter